MSSIFVNNYTHGNILTVTGAAYHTKVAIEIPAESTVNDLLDVFKSIALALGYAEVSWDNAIAQAYAASEERLEEIRNLYAPKTSINDPDYISDTMGV
jgi:hypothetical protein